MSIIRAMASFQELQKLTSGVGPGGESGLGGQDTPPPFDIMLKSSHFVASKGIKFLPLIKI